MPGAQKPVLSGFPPDLLRELLEPLPPYRARQIFRWISRGVPSFGEMTDLPLDLREELDRRFTLYTSGVSQTLRDQEGAAKLQITLADGARIEAVLLQDGEGRKTACLSTQAGCAMGCVFCKTGTLGFQRNLEAAEITEQFHHLRALGGDVSNVVIMGMGEPLLNLAELRRALAVLSAPEGLGLSRRRITLSTCGIVQGIRDLGERGPDVRLALSLTAADEGLRERLMPVSRTNPLPALKEALGFYQEKTGQRLTLEAVLLGGLNTRPRDAEALARFARGLDAVVNLIPWNPVEGLCFEGEPLREPAAAETDFFADQLEKRGLKVTRRFRRGRSISGACGQLGLVPRQQFSIHSSESEGTP
jgi:23S rRNA (adenine2503-C2)-methyltransferase